MHTHEVTTELAQEGAIELLEKAPMSRLANTGIDGFARVMVRISITPAWARFFDFGAGRMPGFLHDLAKPQ